MFWIFWDEGQDAFLSGALTYLHCHELGIWAAARSLRKAGSASSRDGRVFPWAFVIHSCWLEGLLDGIKVLRRRWGGGSGTFPSCSYLPTEDSTALGSLHLWDRRELFLFSLFLLSRILCVLICYCDPTKPLWETMVGLDKTQPRIDIRRKH